MTTQAAAPQETSGTTGTNQPAILSAFNPATETLIAEYPAHDAHEIERALERAAAAAATWKHTDFEQRANLLRNVAAILRQEPAGGASLIRSDAVLIAEEMGKPIEQARAEIEKCAWVCDYYAEHGAEFLATERIETDGSSSGVRYDPLGVILAVMPWNFPFWQVFRFAAPAVMAGNVGLLKHASNVPGCSARIEEIFHLAGAPAGVFQSLLIGSGAIADIIADDRIAAVTLTGSEPAGRAVASAAANHVKKSVLELGGSDPFIVLADADLDAAADAAITARTLNGGQSCIAAKRFIVEEAVYQPFVDRLTERVGKLTIGNPLDADTDIGPLARPEFVADIHDIVERSIEQGARLIHGGTPSERLGYFYEPTLLVDCDASTACFREETFGPVAAVASVPNLQAALSLANDTEFGLGASIWSASDQVESLIERLEAGHVAVNGIVKSDPRLPFGGIKRSGYGRELSRHGILEFVNHKSYWVA